MALSDCKQERSDPCFRNFWGCCIENGLQGGQVLKEGDQLGKRLSWEGKGLEKDRADRQWVDWDSSVEMVEYNRTC